jgi:transposase
VAHQYCLAHLIRDAQYAIDAGDTVFAPAFKHFLQKACAIGRRRPDLADATIKAYARHMRRDLDSLLKLKPTEANGRHLRDSMIVDGHDKLLVFLTRRDVEPTNNVSERALRPSVVYRKVTNGFRSGPNHLRGFSRNDLRRRTPGPPPFSSMNSTPAASKAR